MGFFKNIIDTIVISFVVLADPFIRFVLFLFPKFKKNIKGEIVLLTGAGHGIGKELAERISALGAILVMWDINQENNEAVASKLRTQGHIVYCYKVDVTNEKEVIQVANRVKEEVGDVAILINNAGVFSGHRICNLPPHAIKRSFEVNCIAHFWILQQFLPRMMELNKGHIVAIASMAGHEGTAYMTDYCASKYGTVGLMESLFMELQFEGKHNIKLTTINPVIITTGLISNVKTRFNCLLPLLPVEKAADIILDSILREKEMVFIPSRTYYLWLFKSLFRRITQYKMIKYTGYGYEPNEVKPTLKKPSEIV